MSNAQRPTKYCKLSNEQKLLILQTRLAWESDFRKYRYSVKQKTQLWKIIQQQLIEKDSTMNGLTIKKLRFSYQSYHILYNRMKARGTMKGTWQRQIYKRFEKAFADNQSTSRNSNIPLGNELYQLVLNARLPRESEFKNSDQQKRILLWQKILEEVKANAVGFTENLTSNRIQTLFYNILSKYKKKKNEKNRSAWPYFDQLDKVYGDDIELKWQKDSIEYKNLEQMVLNARLSREAEFQKLPAFKQNKLWQQILCEVKANTTCSWTEELNSDEIKKIFKDLLFKYRNLKRKQKINCWPYFDQIDKIYGNEFEMKEGSVEYKKLEQLVLNARLSRDAEFKKYATTINTFEGKKLWQDIVCEVKAKAADCRFVELNRRKIQRIFANLVKAYKIHKRNENGSFWPYFDQMDKICTNNDNPILVLKPYSYKRINDELKNLVICSRLSREATFKQCQKLTDQIPLWQEILHEVKANLKGCCTEELYISKIKYIFRYMRELYKTHRKNGNISWPYYEQFHRVYGNCEPFEIFTTDNDNQNVVCNVDSISATKPASSRRAVTLASTTTMQILKKEAFSDRRIFQQICDIEKDILQLQRAEIDELRKLIIFYENKKPNKKIK